MPSPAPSPNTVLKTVEEILKSIKAKRESSK